MINAHRRPVMVTGHGRSGTHWLAGVLGRFVPTIHEPEDMNSEVLRNYEVVVDCHLTRQLSKVSDDYPTVHLVRDGREVVRSAFEFYQGHRSFDELCEGWASTVRTCRGLPVVRLNDLLRPVAVSKGFRLSHWKEWPDDLTATFWRICGPEMDHYGFDR